MWEQADFFGLMKQRYDKISISSVRIRQKYTKPYGKNIYSFNIPLQLKSQQKPTQKSPKK